MKTSLGQRTGAFVEACHGAALIEYTILIGVVVVAVMTAIISVGGWVNSQWTAVNALLN